MTNELELLKNKGVHVEESFDGLLENLDGQYNTTSKNIWVKSEEKKPNFKKLSLEYDAAMLTYLFELNDRAFIFKESYEKLVEDLLTLRENGFCASQNPQSYTYQKGRGFVIAAPYKASSISDEEIVRCAFLAVFGNGLPEFYVDFESKNMIFDDLQSMLKKSETICILRLAEVLIAYGISYETTFDTIAECYELIDKKPEVLEEDNNSLCDRMSRFYEEIKNKEEHKKEGLDLQFTKSE